jgi:heme-degrading monooxygenase HmoA
MEEMLLVLYSFVIGGNSEAFERTYREYLPQQEHFSGHLGEMLVRAENDATSYTIVSRWKTSAFYRWLKSPEHDSMVEMLNSFQRAQSNVQKFAVVPGQQIHDDEK